MGERPASAPALTPGEWTTTGWGAQHRVRRSDERWTELVCHRLLPAWEAHRPGESARCETSRIDRSAEETARCPRCAALPDLGPIELAPLGEVRRAPAGLVAVCIGDGGLGDRRWKVIGEDPEGSWRYGWRTDWDVAVWATVGNVQGMEDLA